MSDNFKKLFGHYNESLALRLYTVLASGVNFDRVYLPTYLFKLHPLFSPELTDQMHFVFSMFDSDIDGEITSKDISDFMKNVLTCPAKQLSGNSRPYLGHTQTGLETKSCDCQFFQEFDVIYQEYVNSNLLTYRTRKTMINFELFLKKVPYSCLIETFIDKLASFNERPSIFSHDYKDLQVLTQLYDIDREMNRSKIGLINSQGVNYSVGECLKRL